MATITEWNKYMTLLHEYALVEYDLRDANEATWLYDGNTLANDLLFSRFGVDIPLPQPVDSP